MKLTIFLGCLVSLLGGIILITGYDFEKYRDEKVVAGETRRLWDVLAVHRSKPQYLKVSGKTYRGVRGMVPYYLNVPGVNSILFVTEESGGRVKFHVVSLTTKHDAEFDAGSSGFGWHIGGSRKPGEPFTDYIENAGANGITIVKKTDEWQERYFLNLATGAIERRETSQFDPNGPAVKR